VTVSPTTVLTFSVLGFIGFRIASGTRLVFTGDGWRRTVLIVKGLRPWHFVLAVPVLFVVLSAVLVLIQIPGLDFGWWSLLGGTGSPVVGVTNATSGSALEWVIPAVFIALLLPALPLFAETEERLFRWGSEARTTWQRVSKAVQFGLLHAAVGIPIGAALALSIGGGYFTWVYLRAYRTSSSPFRATLGSTRAHLAYNLTVIVIIVLSVAVLGTT
jgi:hypothetical protein